MNVLVFFDVGDGEIDADEMVQLAMLHENVLKVLSSLYYFITSFSFVIFLLSYFILILLYSVFFIYLAYISYFSLISSILKHLFNATFCVLHKMKYQAFVH